LAPIRRKRRSWNRDEKRRIVAESLEEGASIAEVARRHALNDNQLDASKNLAKSRRF
jgi:transposase